MSQRTLSLVSYRGGGTAIIKQRIFHINGFSARLRNLVSIQYKFLTSYEKKTRRKDGQLILFTHQNIIGYLKIVF